MLCRALSEQVILAGFVPLFPQETSQHPPDPVFKRTWRHSCSGMCGQGHGDMLATFPRAESLVL